MKYEKIYHFGYLAALLFLINACTNDTVAPDLCLNGPQLQVDIIQSSVIGKSSGIVTVVTAEGTAPYTYSIDGTNFQSNGTFENLSAGDYTVIVKDDNNCTDMKSVTVSEVPEVFYSNQIRPILDADCQKSGCHDSNSTIPSWATYAVVKANAELIKTKTSNKTMPPTGALTPTKIQLIADWVDQGAPEN